MGFNYECGYNGLCNERCATCGGPDATSWYTCGPHSTASASHDNLRTLTDNRTPVDQLYECNCDSGWGGPKCYDYMGDCDGRCEGCVGPDNNDCIRCVKNASRDTDGLCVCNIGWGGTSCTEYTGDCVTTCDGGVDGGQCTGPTTLDCITWSANALRDIFGRWVWTDGWSADDCTSYRGKCHPICQGMCNGPSNNDWINCLGLNEHAELNPGGECVCQENWTGSVCELFNGSWHVSCLGCSGPTSLDWI